MNLEPDVSPWFWEVIAASQCTLRLLCRQLEGMSKDEIVRYQAQYERAKEAINPYCDDGLWRFVSSESGPSEDHADDFAAWVVTQGRAYYEEVRGHPENFQRYLDLFTDEVDSGFGRSRLRWDEEVDNDAYRGYQSADGIASAIYRDRFSEDLWRAVGELG
jgi:hypothetical protein